MKKTIIIPILAIGLVVLTGVGVASAFGPDGTKVGFGEKSRGGRFMTEVKHSLETQALILGLTTDELEIALKNGQRLPDIAEKKGMSAEDFHLKMQEQIKTNLQALVQEGKITQEKADQQLIIMSEKQKNREMIQPIMEGLHLHMQAAISEYLGVPTNDLAITKEHREVIGSALKNKGVSTVEFHAHIDEARNTYIASQVEQGIITETQAEQLKKGSLRKNMHNHDRLGRKMMLKTE